MNCITNEQFQKLCIADPDFCGVYTRYISILKEVKRLKENRDVESDAIDDTRSYDVNIAILNEKANDAAQSMNWTCKKLGMGLVFPYE